MGDRTQKEGVYSLLIGRVIEERKTTAVTTGKWADCICLKAKAAGDPIGDMGGTDVL